LSILVANIGFIWGLPYYSNTISTYYARHASDCLA